MNKVAKAVLKPHHCAVNPHLGSEPKKGLWDTGQDLQGPGVHVHRVYIAVSTIEDLARREGWISPEEHQNQRTHIEALVREKDALEEQVASLEAVVDSIDVLESAAFKARKRAGRMPKEKTVA